MRPRPALVMQVVLSLNPGGTERLVVELVRRLRPAIPMAVCCLDTSGSWGDDLRAEGIALEQLDRRPGFRPGLAASLRAAAVRCGARVLHCHQYSPFVYAALGRALSPNLRVIYTEHGRLSDAPPSVKRRLVNPVLARAAHRIFSVSHDLRRHMIAEGLPASRVEVVHNGIDPAVGGVADREEVRRVLQVGSGTLVLITVARLDPVKDLSTLLQAVRLLKDAALDVALAVVGDGPETPALEAEARSLGIAASVRFLGHRDDARWWLSGADIYVSSSVSEGISLTILEGMAAGLPIVATSVGGTPEIVDDTCGVLVPARDPARLAAALIEMSEDANRRRRLGAAAKRRVMSSFSLDRMVATYQRVYEEAC